MTDRTTDPTFTTARRSVETLLGLAIGDSGGATPAALVLLSAYNSQDFQVPVDELCRLDPDNYRHAINIITLRYRGIEPHEVIEHGARRFDALWERWEHLRTPTRSPFAAA